MIPLFLSPYQFIELVKALKILKRRQRKSKRHFNDLVNKVNQASSEFMKYDYKKIVI